MVGKKLFMYIKLNLSGLSVTIQAFGLKLAVVWKRCVETGRAARLNAVRRGVVSIQTYLLVGAA